MLVFSLVELGGGFGPVTPQSFGSGLIKARLDGALNNLVWLKMSLLTAGWLC